MVKVIVAFVQWNTTTIVCMDPNLVSSNEATDNVCVELWFINCMIIQDVGQNYAD